MEFRPSGAPVTRYNDPPVVPPAPSELADRIVSVVHQAARAAGKPLPVADGRLYAVAADVAALSLDDAPLPYRAIEFALTQRGIIEPTPHLVVVRASEGDWDGVVDELERRVPDIVARGRFARVGVASAPAGGGLVAIVLALQESFVETDPIPRFAGRGERIWIRGRLRPPFSDPKLYVTTPEGFVETMKVAREGRTGFRAELACSGRPGRFQVEITGHDERGTSVLANFPVWCEETPPESLTLLGPASDEPPVASEREAERRIFELLAADRRRAGLPPLQWDERAARVARAHSREMRDEGFVGHLSPTTGSAADRVARAGLTATIVLENVARAYSPAEAHVGLMNSPGHRANLLSDEVTHVGIGVVFGRTVTGRPELYVTQVFLGTRLKN